MPQSFPREAVLRNGRRVIVRPFVAGDADDLHQFFVGLPEPLRRFAWNNVEDPRLVESWARDLDYDRVLPLLALDGDRIVADATLHRRKRGPLRLVGRIKWLIDPAYRGVGLGTTLVNVFITIARSIGLRHLGCMLISELEKDAIETLSGLGFEEHRVAGYGVDPDGVAHDMSKLVLRL